MNMKGKRDKNLRNRGITLIALVITIIVLLILAGVSIATLTGENGIITQATEAKEQTEKESKKEQKRLAQLEATMNSEETEYKGVKIPAYCAPTRIEGESTIDEGLAIIDKNGNEWIWIEVPKSIYVTATSNTDYANIEKDMQNYAIDYRQTSEETTSQDFTDTWRLANQGFKNADDYNNYKNNMLKSVYDNGGFYIGRYETGTQTARTSESDSITTPIIQEGAYPYNFVECSTAQSLSNQLAVGNKTTSLMFGIQWDLIMKFLEEKGAKSQRELKSGSASWGNYYDAKFDVTGVLYTASASVVGSGIWTEIKSSYTKLDSTKVILTTGATDRNKALNIYDLAGNLNEWTLETLTWQCHNVMRGGRADAWGGGAGAPCAHHDYYSPTLEYCGFRVALY